MVNSEKNVEKKLTKGSVVAKNPYLKDPKTRFKDIKKLDKREADEQIHQLAEAIHHHDYLYYVKNQPIISDRKYDKLYKRLQALEGRFPDLRPQDSPTMRVGAEPVDKLKKVDHIRPMLSLDSALEGDKIKDFIDFVERHIEKKRIEYILEPKFDGFSVELVYEHAEFKYGATRGNGVTGEDISENLKTIKAIPLHLQTENNPPDFIAVRGEVLMPKDGFQKLNKERIKNNEDPFANPRNAAAGIMRQLDPQKVANKPLDVFFYTIMQSRNGDIADHWQALKKLSQWGFKVNENKIKTDSFKKIENYYQDVLSERDDLNYDIDGVVLKVNDEEIKRDLGERENSPRWAIAWKFPPREEVTTLFDIVVQVGKSGMLTPVALLDPVDVGGVTVSRASLHNEEMVREKDVRSGDKVRIKRAGDVIPEVVERVEDHPKGARSFSMPGKCPSCGTNVVKEGAYYFCPAGLQCRAQLIGRIIHYASREAMNIENLGDKIAKHLVQRNMVQDLADLYHLSKKDILKLNGFAEKSSQQLYEDIQNSKRAKLDRFLYALGIRHVGRHIARVLASHFSTLERLQKATQKELEKIDEIGDEIAASVYHFFNDKQNQRILKHLFAAGVEIESMPTQQEQPLKGKTFVFTGELDAFSRDQAESKVEQLGGRATSSVSGNTDYVVVGENPGSKLDNAKKQGIKTMDEKAFKKMIQS